MTLSVHSLEILFLISLRLGMVLFFAPIVVLRQLPATVRYLLLFIVGALISRFIPNPDIKDLWIAGVCECCNGLVLLLSVYACCTTFQIAGQYLDNFIGINTLAVINPLEKTEETISSRYLYLLANLFFFNLQGHVWLFKGIVQSFDSLPPGSLALLQGFTPIIKQFAFMFSMVLLICAPIAVSILVVDVCTGFISRSLPQSPLYLIVLPAKLLLGLVLLTVLMPILSPIANTIMTHCFATWQEILS